MGEGSSSASLASAKRAIALLVASLLLVFASLYLVKPSFGAEVTSRKDALSTAAPSTAANHTITFTLATGNAWDATETITVDLNDADDPTNFDTSGFATTDATDYDIADDGVDYTLVAAAGCGAGATEIEITAIDTTNDKFTFTLCTGDTSIAAGSVVTIEIGTHATAGGTGNTQITNPAKVAAAGTADTYKVVIAGTAVASTSSEIIIAIQDDVTVSVTVDEFLTFTVAGIASGSCTGDSGTFTAVTTTATTIPYATVNTEAFYAGCQTLTVSTNASGGYVVTESSNTSLKSGATVLSSGNCDGTCDFDTGTAWATATNNGLAFWCENGTGSPCSTAGDTTSEYRTVACRGVDADCDPGTGAEAGQNVFSKGAAASGDQGEFHLKISVSDTQAQGSYSNLLTYVATPTF